MEAYKNLIKDIENYIAKLETASLTMDELFELEKLTRKLHERSIILRYKAFENKVGVESVEAKEEPTPEPVVEPEPEVIEEPKAEEGEELEFNIFDNEEEEDLGFVFEAPQEDLKPEVEEKEEEIEIEPKDEVEPQEVEPQPSEPTPEPTSQGGSFIDRFKTADNSLSSQFAGSKLDSLIGAFGLNEKLMFINELFDGSSEMFSDAIKALDTKSSFDDASAMLDELANEHSWDPEEEAVAEFIVYIQRRHA